MSMKAQERQDQIKPRVAPSALTLLESARQGLATGRRQTPPASKYAAAHLAVLRAAAAVVTARSASATATHNRRPQSLWELLPTVEPALSGWAAYFAAGARQRAVAEGGLSRPVSAREAEDLLCDAENFVSLAEKTLGVTDLPIADAHDGTGAAPGPDAPPTAAFSRPD